MESLNTQLTYLKITDIKGEDIFRKDKNYKCIYEVRIYGRTIQGESRCIHVPNFKPYAYVGYYAPTEGMRTVMLQFINKCILPMLEAVPAVTFGDRPAKPKEPYRLLENNVFEKQGKKVLGKQMKMGFDSSDTNSVFWRFDFDTKREQLEFQRRWRTAFPSCQNTYTLLVENMLNDIEKYSQTLKMHIATRFMDQVSFMRRKMVEHYFPPDMSVNLFHSLLSPDILFTHEKQIQPSGWISYPTSYEKNPPLAVLNFSTTKKDVEVPMEDIVSIVDNKYLNEYSVNIVIGSTDIETTGLYAVQATSHMVTSARTFLNAFRRLRRKFLDTLSSPDVDYETPEEIYQRFVTDCVYMFLHFFGKKIDDDLRQYLRCDFIMEEFDDSLGKELPINYETVLSFLTSEIEYSWYQKLLDIFREEKTLTESQRVLAQNREKELRDMQLSKHLMNSTTAMDHSTEGDDYGMDVLENGAGRDYGSDSDTDNDDTSSLSGNEKDDKFVEEDDDSSSHSSYSSNSESSGDEENSNKKERRSASEKKKKKKTRNEDEEEDHSEEEEVDAVCHQSKKRKRLQKQETKKTKAKDVRVWLANVFPFNFSSEAMMHQSYSQFKVSHGNDSLARLLFDGRIFQDKIRGAELLTYYVRKAFGLQKSDRVYDITTSIMYPHQSGSFTRTCFLCADHFKIKKENNIFEKVDIRKLPQKYWDSTICWCENEQEVLLKWRDWYVDVADIDMHIGFNISAFDIPFLYLRAKKYRLLSKFMQMSKVRGQICSGKKPYVPPAARANMTPAAVEALRDPVLETKYTKIKNGEALQEMIPQEGRSELDMLIFFKKNKNYPCYSLDYTTSMTITEEVKKMEIRKHELWILTKKFLGLQVDDFIHLQLKSNFVINNVGSKLRVVRLVQLEKKVEIEPGNAWKTTEELWIIVQLPLESMRFDRILPRKMFNHLHKTEFDREIKPLLTHYPQCITNEETTVQTIKQQIIVPLRKENGDQFGEKDCEDGDDELLLDDEELVQQEEQHRKLQELIQSIEDEKHKNGKRSGMTLTWGFAKDDMDHVSMQKFASSGALDEFMLLVKYCIRDCELPLLLFKNLGVWDSFSEISKLAQVSLNLTLTRGESIRLHSFITNMGRMRKVFLSDSYHPFTDDRTKKVGKKYKNFEGAFVIPPLTKLYSNRDIIVDDFNSLYPSLILSYLLGHCSKTLRIEVDLEGKVVKTWTAWGLIRQLEIYKKIRGLQSGFADPAEGAASYGDIPIHGSEQILTHDGKDGLGDISFLLQSLHENQIFHEEEQRPDVMYFRSVDKEEETGKQDDREFMVINQKFPVRKNVDPKEVDGPNTKRKKLVEKIVGYVYIFYCVERHFMRRTLTKDHVKTLTSYFMGEHAAVPNLKDRFKLPIIGAMCENFLIGRKIAKNKMAVAKKEGNMQAYSMYNAEQGAVKQMNNSVYGSTGNANGGYFCDFDIASTTTSLGRLYILYSSSMTSCANFVTPTGVRMILNPHLHEDAGLVIHPVEVEIPHSLEEVGDLINDLEANTRLVERFRQTILETPILQQDRLAMQMAEVRFKGLFALEHTNGFLKYRDSILEELSEKENFSGRMQWSRLLCSETGRMVWYTHTEDEDKGKESETLKKVAFVEFRENPTVYGDTDSVFFTPIIQAFAVDGVTEITSTLTEVDIRYIEKALGEAVGTFVSQIAPPPMNLAYEKILHRPLLANRKRYAAIKFENDMMKGVALVMGLGICRKDTPDYIKSILVMMLSHFQASTPMEEIIAEIKEKIDYLLEGKVPLDQLVLTCSIKAHYANPDNVKQVRLAARIAAREPAKAPKPGDRVQFLHIVPKGMNMILDRYRIDPIKVGERIETPDFVEKEHLPLDYYHYIVKILFNQMMQYFGLAIDLVYDYLGKKEDYEKTVVPHLQKLDQSCRDEKGDLKDIFNKKKNDYCTEMVKSLLGPILFPDYNKVVRTTKAAKEWAKATGNVFIPVRTITINTTSTSGATSLAASGACKMSFSSSSSSFGTSRPKPTNRTRKLFPVFEDEGDLTKKRRRRTSTNQEEHHEDSETNEANDEDEEAEEEDGLKRSSSATKVSHRLGKKLCGSEAMSSVMIASHMSSTEISSLSGGLFKSEEWFNLKKSVNAVRDKTRVLSSSKPRPRSTKGSSSSPPSSSSSAVVGQNKQKRDKNTEDMSAVKTLKDFFSAKTK